MDDAILLVEVTSFYLKNQTRTTTLYGASFKIAARARFLELHELFFSIAVDFLPSFIPIMTVKLDGLQSKSLSMILLFLTTMLLFRYDPCNKWKRWADSGQER